MKEYVEVPIDAAKYVAEAFDKQEIIILAIDRTHDKVHTTTYGTTKQGCKNAAATGDFLREILQVQPSKTYSDLIEEIKKRYLAKR